MAAINLSLGIYDETGGLYASITGLRWVLFDSTLTSVVASGNALSTNASGVATLSIGSSPYNPGDYVPLFVTTYNSATTPPDRVVRTMFGFVPAT